MIIWFDINFILPLVWGRVQNGLLRSTFGWYDAWLQVHKLSFAYQIQFAYITRTYITWQSASNTLELSLIQMYWRRWHNIFLLRLVFCERALSTGFLASHNSPLLCSPVMIYLVCLDPQNTCPILLLLPNLVDKKL